MAKKIFTDKEVAFLKQNPYVKKVSTTNISYTQDFKDMFVAGYNKGSTPLFLFEKHNFPVAVLGINRIKAAAKRWLNKKDEYLKLENRISYLEKENEILRKASKTKHLKEEKFRIIESIKKDKTNKLSVASLCKAAGVSASGYYAFLKRINAKDYAMKDKEDFAWILKAYNIRGYNKGVRSIYMHLIRLGHPMNHKKIRRIMRKFGLFCPIRRPKQPKIIIKDPICNKVPDLVQRRFKSYGPRIILLTDITYLTYGFNQKAYLSTIIDAYTNEVLAYQVKKTLNEELVCATVEMLMEKHRFELSIKTVIHSDQGIYYATNTFQNLIKRMNLLQSMSRRGNCWDNAPQESFFGHLKDEVNLKQVNSFLSLTKEIDRYMDYYNNYRMQWLLNKLTPAEYYKYLTTGKHPDSACNKKTAF